MNKKLVLCISAIILIILGITVINKKEDGITANNAGKLENIEDIENMEEMEEIEKNYN